MVDYITYNEYLNIDREFGKNGEDDIKPILEEYFYCEVQKQKKFYWCDFKSICCKNYFEIKRRRNSADKYPDSMIAFSKILKATEILAEDDSCKIIYVFIFTDGIFYYNFRQIKPEWIRKGGTNRRGRPEFTQYYYIPVSEMTKII